MDGAILTTIAIQFNILSQTRFLLNIIVVGSARTYFRNQAGLQLSLSHSSCCHYNPFSDFPSIAIQKSNLCILMSQVGIDKIFVHVIVSSCYVSQMFEIQDIYLR